MSSAKFSATVFKRLDISTRDVLELLPHLPLVPQMVQENLEPGEHEQLSSMLDTQLCNILELNAKLEKTIDVLLQSNSGGENYEQAVARLGTLLQTFTDLLQTKRPNAVKDEIPLADSTAEYCLWDTTNALRSFAVDVGFFIRKTESTTRSFPEANIVFTIRKKWHMNNWVNFDVFVHCANTNHLFGEGLEVSKYSKSKTDQAARQNYLISWLKYVKNGCKVYILNHDQCQRACELIVDGIHELMAAGDNGEEETDDDSDDSEGQGDDGVAVAAVEKNAA